MKHILTLSLCFLALSLSAQETITYPYNPDGNADGLVAVPDIQDLLAVYGSPFSPAEIMVGDTALSEWIQILYQALQDQQAVIDAMQGAGGCNWQLPEGIQGDFVVFNPSETSYIVPSNKRLYIIQRGEDGSHDIWLNGTHFELDHEYGPLILNENDEISVPPNTGGSVFIYGILVEPDSNIEPIWLFVEPFLSGMDPYQVPEGKNLVVLYTTGLQNLILNGLNTHLSGNENNLPFIIPELINISSDNVSGVLHGYLVDEDYFADCGSGGSSEGGSVSSLDSLTIASMINNAILQQIGHGDNYQGGIVAYIFQPGDAAYVAGEVHGYLAYYDGTTIGWGCEGVTTAIGVNNTSVGQGPVNTQQLVNTCTESDFAAKWCNDLVIGGNSDWFLPNVSELMLFQPAALYTICGGCSITAWTSQEAVVGLYGCSGNSNSCCYPVDFANTFCVTGSGNELGSHNRKMPGGINACGGWGGSHVIAYRQF